MKSILAEATNWLGGTRYGKTYKDKTVLFLYIVNALIVIIFIASVFGKSKVIDVYFKRAYLLNWIPVKSVLIRRYDILLSLPIILDKLQLNCKLNNLHTAGYHLFLINKAVSDKHGIEAQFYESHSMSTMCKEFLTSISNSIINEELSKKIVRTVTIDSL